MIKYGLHVSQCILVSCLYLNVGLLEVMRPGGEEVLSHLLIKITSIRNEGSREKTVTSDGGHLILEGLAGLFPTLTLCR